MRPHIVRIARTWLGTPYHHQASLKGVGTDCVGLVRGVWRELYGSEPQALPAYTRDWAEGGGRETLIEAARRHLAEIRPCEAQPGDVLVFRWRRGAPAKHCAILSAVLPLPACGERAGVRGSHMGAPIGSASMIHALEGAPVSEVPLSPWWRRHLAGAFQFPVGSDPAGLTPFAIARPNLRAKDMMHPNGRTPAALRDIEATGAHSAGGPSCHASAPTPIASQSC
jgi:NlpC/P60 family putative phage cell wall peptidase